MNKIKFPTDSVEQQVTAIIAMYANTDNEQKHLRMMLQELIKRNLSATVKTIARI